VTNKIGTPLTAFGERAELRMTEVAQYASPPVSTAHRLIGELVECGLLQRGAGGRYHVSAALHQLAVGPTRPIVEYRSQICQALEDLELVTGYRARFGVLLDHGVSCLERSRRLSHGFCLAAGPIVPAHATAVGKALLAHAPPEFLALLVQRGLPRYTAPGRRYRGSAPPGVVTCSREGDRCCARRVAEIVPRHRGASPSGRRKLVRCSRTGCPGYGERKFRGSGPDCRGTRHGAAIYGVVW
jgi:hypothetical protein